MTTENKRLRIKRSTVALQAPTVPATTNHADGTWLVTDIYKGELFINLVDEKFYTRVDSGIIEFTPSGVCLPLAGGTMSGSIDMAGNNLNNVGSIAGLSDLEIGANGYISLTSPTSNISLTGVGVYLDSGAGDFTLNGVVLSEGNAGVIAVTSDIAALSSVYQPLDGDLTAIAALSGSAGFLKKTGTDTWSIDTAAYATQAYADALVVGLLDDRGNFDASVNLFPSSGGSGTAGAVLKGDLWTISVAGTLGGVVVTAGDVVRSLSDTPGQTSSNWAIGENNFGYVALNQALADGKIYVGNGSGIGTAVTPSGHVTFSNSGVTTIGAGVVTNAMLAGSIAYSKLSLTGAILNADLAGSIDLTTKVTGILPGTNGGTGVNNASKLITLGGNLTTTGAFNLTLAVPQTTTYTLPNTASETLAGLGTAQTFTAVQRFTGATTELTGIYLLNTTYKNALDATIGTGILRLGTDFSNVIITPGILRIGSNPSSNHALSVDVSGTNPCNISSSSANPLSRLTCSATGSTSNTTEFSFYLKDSAANTTKAVGLVGSLSTITDGSETGLFAIRTILAGTEADRITVNGTAASFLVPVGLPQFAKASLPVATTAGRQIWVTDDVSGACVAYSNGSNWKRQDTNATIA